MTSKFGRNFRLMRFPFAVIFALNDSKMRNTVCTITLSLQMTNRMRNGLFLMDQSIRFGLRV